MFTYISKISSFCRIYFSFTFLPLILISFFLLYYLLGILVGFAKTANYLTIKSIVKIIIPLIIYIVLKEFLRYQLLTKASENKALITIITIFYIMMDLTIPFSFHSLTLGKEIFLLIAVTFLPIVTENILLSFLSLNFGYKPSILYLIIIKLYWYILPIVPNPNEYIYSLIFFLLPVVILLKIKRWLAKDRVESIVENSYKKRKKSSVLEPFCDVCGAYRTRTDHLNTASVTL